ncbi:MAG: urate hydroxylase PuuD [Nitrospiraceae bacterium]
MKFLENPLQTMVVGFVLTAALAAGWIVVTGIAPALDSWVETMFRWAHYLAGITWIGLLYFFNLINAGFLKSLDAGQKGVVVPRLMPSALAWFRHGATVTVLAGIGLIVILHPSLSGTGDKAAWLGGLLGLIMMANVHAIIWPCQKQIIRMTEESTASGKPTPPEMADLAKKALYASRINFMLSIPMLFFMGAASHLK